MYRLLREDRQGEKEENTVWGGGEKGELLLEGSPSAAGSGREGRAAGGQPRPSSDWEGTGRALRAGGEAGSVRRDVEACGIAEQLLQGLGLIIPSRSSFGIIYWPESGAFCLGYFGKNAWHNTGCGRNCGNWRRKSDPDFKSKPRFPDFIPRLFVFFFFPVFIFFSTSYSRSRA